MSEQRWKDAEKGTFQSGPVLNAEKLKGDEPQFVKEYHDYYRTPRGFHERSLNSTGAWNATTPLSFMNMPLLTYIKEIAPRPVLLIAGEKAHSRYFSEEAYKAAAEPKELIIIPNAVLFLFSSFKYRLKNAINLSKGITSNLSYKST